MGKLPNFSAKLVGELDGEIVSKEFEDARTAIAWAEGEGLVGFQSHSVRAEVRIRDGSVWWQKSDLKPFTRLRSGGRKRFMKWLWSLLLGLLVFVSILLFVERLYLLEFTSEEAKAKCALEPVTFYPRQYSDCLRRHM